jgi:hypothetical protein
MEGQGLRGAHQGAVAAPRKSSQLFQGAHDAVLQGIAAHIEDDPQEICVIEDRAGAKAVLEQVPYAAMPPVEIDGVTRVQAGHQGSEWLSLRLQDQVDVIGQQRPSEAGGLGAEENRVEPS